MCLIFLAWRRHPDYRLVVAANRDEFYARPTAPAGYWPGEPDVLAGRDLEGGGTWLGVTRAGRFAALTNYRRGDGHIPDAPTRGRLVSDFLLSESSPGTLGPGIYAVSNDLLDTPWPKVVRGKDSFQRLLQARDIDPSTIFDLLSDRQSAADEALPDTGIGLARERKLSPIFIAAGDYGTRSSTVLLIDGAGDIAFHERTHESGIAGTETLTYTYPVEPDREAV
jgi:uncharacterized protein with NRDE domain